jgi:hypothetical protein
LRGTGIRPQELILRQDTGFQKRSDQSHHPAITDALAHAIEKVVMIDIVKHPLMSP